MNNIFVGLIVFFANSVVYAAENDVFRPFINAGYTYDSNLLRVDTSLDPLVVTGESGLSDVLKKYAVGFDFNKDISQQNFSFTAEVSNNSYERFKFLDYKGRNINAIWKWKTNKFLKGNLGVRHLRSLASFAEIGGIKGNLRDQNQIFFKSELNLESNWSFQLYLSNFEVTYADEQQKLGDIKSYTITPSFVYLSSSGSKFSIGVKKEIGKYPYRELSNLNSLDNKFMHNEFQVSMDWIYSVKTKFKFKVARVEREHENIDSRDYSATNVRFSTLYKPTYSTIIEFDLWSETAPQDDLVSTVSENSGYSISSSWDITEKTTFSGHFQKTNRKSSGNATLSQTNNLSLKEKNDIFALTVSYYPIDNFSFNANYVSSSRDSNRLNSDYDSKVFSIGAEIKI